MYFKVTLLITDGVQTQIADRDEPSPERVATAMKNRGITIVALGIGTADPIELWEFASRPNDTVYVEDFSQLSTKVVKTAEILCPSKLC